MSEDTSLSSKIGANGFNGNMWSADVKEFIKQRLYDATKLLALFNQDKLTSAHLREHRQQIKDDAGEGLI